jgi:hypothetical protein
MDNFDNALDSIGLEVESVKNTHEKLEEESKESGMGINQQRQASGNSQKIFYGLSCNDRDQAVKEFIVPKAYENASFDIEKIKDNLREQYLKNKIYKVKKFDKYTGICQEILSTIRMKQLPRCSYLIGAPNGFGKTSFVNECLITLRKQGYKVVPYISLWELAQIKVDNEHRIMKPYRKFKEENGTVIYSDPNKPVGYSKSPEVITGRFSYSEYINADCLFVSFTDVVSKDIESHTLYQLLNIRGIKGLPTIAMISTSLEPYENDVNLREQVWNEIKAYSEKEYCYDRIYHVSCYKQKSLGINNKGDIIENDTGIIMGENNDK